MSPTLAKCRVCLTGLVRRFGRSGSGATAVEFGLIAAPFLATLLAIFQTCIFLFAQATLQNAAVQAGRLFLTGQAQSSGTTQSQFQTQICPMVQALFTCSNVMVNVQAYSDFSSANASAPTLTFNSQGQVSNSWSYTAGSPGQVMVVQLIYLWPIVGGPFGYILPNVHAGKTEIMGVTAFRVEPY